MACVCLAEGGQIKGCQRHSTNLRVGFNLAWMYIRLHLQFHISVFVLF